MSGAQEDRTRRLVDECREEKSAVDAEIRGLEKTLAEKRERSRELDMEIKNLKSSDSY
jgi:hypothetical protein